MTVLDPVIHFLLLSARKKVTLDQVVEGTEFPRKAVLRILDKLSKEGFLEQIGDEPLPRMNREYGPIKRNPTWLIIGDVSERPKMRPKRDTLRDKIWRRIWRQKRGFTRTDLMRSSGAGVSTVEDFTKLLERNNILKTIGKKGNQKVFAVTKKATAKRPWVGEKMTDEKKKELELGDGWLKILEQRVDKIGNAATARELGISPTAISLLLNNRYPAGIEKMAKRVMKMYGQGGKVQCPVQMEISPEKCADTYNKAKKIGVRCGNPRLIRLYKTCIKCDLRNS